MEEKCHSESDTTTAVVDIINSALTLYSGLSSFHDIASHNHQQQHHLPLHHHHQHYQHHHHHHQHHLHQQAAQEQQHNILINPSTSGRSNNSMSVLQEDYLNRHNNYSEVIDDETTTSGELDTFEISSSNSLPACSDSVDPIAVDDSSSTDTIKLSQLTAGQNKNNNNNNSHQHFINDDDEVYVIEDDDLPPTNEQQKSHLNLSASHLVDASLNGVITTPSGTKVFLETPIVEEQQQQQLVNLVGQRDFFEKNGHPKRLSDEFRLVENSEIIEVDTNDEDEDDDDDDNENGNGNDKNQIEQSSSSSSKSPSSFLKVKILNSNLCKDAINESQHEKMSFRLKKMTLSSGRCIENPLSRNSHHHESNFRDTCTSDAAQLPDIESMDYIERRDFETEQKLTGGITLKNRSLIDQNRLNLNIIKSCIQPTTAQRDFGDDIPCSSTSNSHVRTVSSDSKCTYKDHTSTPTSSRTFNQAKSKSTTAKLNLYNHLSYGEDAQDFPKPSASSIQGKVPELGPFTVDDDGPTTSSTITSSRIKGQQNLFKVNGSKSDLFCSSNSNDSLSASGGSNNNTETRNSTTTETTHREKRSSEHWQSDLNDNQGCSRTTGLKQQTSHSNNSYESSLNMPAAYDEDAQPSTSSARCQVVRQVHHASAQTVASYLPRSSGSSTSSSSLNNNSSNDLTARGRRRTDSNVSSSRKNNTNEETSSSTTAFKNNSAEKPLTTGSLTNHEMFHDNSWIDCDETNSLDQEEICTCHYNSLSDDSGSNTSLNENEDFDFTNSKVTSQFLPLEDSATLTADGGHNVSSSHANALQHQQRKRKYNDSRSIDTDGIANKNSGCNSDINSRKRVAYDCAAASSPRSSQLLNVSTPSSQLHAAYSPMGGKRTPRSLIPSRDNPPPELQTWLQQFQRWSNAERLLAVDRLIDQCNPTQVRHMMKIIEPQFQRDFISLLPRELALSVLSYLEPKDLLRAAQTCRSWRFLCDDNLLWKEKCRKAQILTEPRTDRPKRGRAGIMPPISSPWKAAYMRQHIIEMNWRSRPIREPKILKGHDDHVITCLQFSGNRIVSGSDDNTLKVWSAVTGGCLRTLVGHTGGVWSSQMSGNIIISGSTDRTLKVWNMETGECIHTLLGHTSTVRCMHLHGKKVVSGSRDATLRVWDIDEGTCLHVLVGHLAAVRCVQYDGKLIVSGAYDYMVKIWHPERQECLHTLQGHTNRVYSLQFDGVHVVSGSLDTSIRVWEVETGNCKHTLMGHQSLTSGMELRQNILVSGNADSTVKVWDITTGQCLQTLSGPNKHQSAVTCLQFNSRFVITSSDDGTVKLWDVKTGEFIRNLVSLESGGSGGVVWRIRASDTKLICAVGSRNGTEETKLMVLDFDVEGACVKCS